MIGLKIAMRAPLTAWSQGRRAGLSAQIWGITLVMSCMPVASTFHLCLLQPDRFDVLLLHAALPVLLTFLACTVVLPLSFSLRPSLELHHWYSSLVSTLALWKLHFCLGGTILVMLVLSSHRVIMRRGESPSEHKPCDDNSIFPRHAYYNHALYILMLYSS